MARFKIILETENISILNKVTRLMVCPRRADHALAPRDKKASGERRVSRAAHLNATSRGRRAMWSGLVGRRHRLVSRTDAGFGRRLQPRCRDAGRSSAGEISAHARLSAVAGGKSTQRLVP